MGKRNGGQLQRANKEDTEGYAVSGERRNWVKKSRKTKTVVYKDDRERRNDRFEFKKKRSTRGQTRVRRKRRS
jgi:hypothetical protein